MKYKNFEKTREKIKEAFFAEVMEKKNFDEVEIKDIISRAGIAKSTFYYHYDDIDDFLDEFYDSVVEKFNEMVAKYYLKNNEKKYGYIKEMAAGLDKYDGFYRRLLRSKKSQTFITKFKNNLVDLIKKDEDFCRSEPNSNLINAEIYMIANGISYLFVDYFREDLDITLDQIAELINQSVLFRLTNRS